MSARLRVHAIVYIVQTFFFAVNSRLGRITTGLIKIAIAWIKTERHFGRRPTEPFCGFPRESRLPPPSPAAAALHSISDTPPPDPYSQWNTARSSEGVVIVIRYPMRTRHAVLRCDVYGNHV